MKRECICNDETLTEEEKWEEITGSSNLGNLSEYKVNQHVGYKWRPCPYSTQVPEGLTRLMLKLSDSDPLPAKVLHSANGTDYFMKVDHSGSWGFRCTFDSCTHFINTGERYFFR